MLSIGIDLGGTNIAAAIVNENGEILSQKSIPCQISKGKEFLKESIRSLVSELLAEANIPLSSVCSIGMGVPGTTIPQTKALCHASNLPILDGMRMTELFPSISEDKLFIENDANAAALGEYIAGIGNGCKNMVMLTLGTGVGGGIIIDGKIYNGFNGAAGEIGHMITHFNGRQCSCGRKGCFEKYASANGLIESAKLAMQHDKSSLLWQLCNGNLDGISGKTIFDAKALGDGCASSVIDEYIEILAAGVINIILLLQPELIVLGGGVAKQKDILLNPIKEIYQREKYQLDGQYTRIEFSSCDNAGLIGAAMLYK